MTRDGRRPLAAIGGVAIAALVVVFLLVGAGALIGVGRRAASPPATPSADTPPVSTPPDTTPRRVALPRLALLGPLVEAVDGEGAVGDLDAETVLRIRADGFEPNAPIDVSQCRQEGTGAVRCANATQAHSDDEGRVAFQYLATEAVGGEGRCRTDASPCWIDLTDGTAKTRLWTVFGDPLAPPGRVDVAAPIEEGAAATVRLTGFPAGAAITVDACRRDRDDDACRTAATTVLNQNGSATVTIDTEEIPCDRREPCVLTARSSERLIRSRVTPLRFLKGPGVDRDPLRLGVGLAVAAALLAMCGWLLVRTDWSPVGEAAAPEIDDAAYADLDALVAALPPEPA